LLFVLCSQLYEVLNHHFPVSWKPDALCSRIRTSHPYCSFTFTAFHSMLNRIPYLSFLQRKPIYQPRQQAVRQYPCTKSLTQTRHCGVMSTSLSEDFTFTLPYLTFHKAKIYIHNATLHKGRKPVRSQNLFLLPIRSQIWEVSDQLGPGFERVQVPIGSHT
jgi:hypothetical protein